MYEIWSIGHKPFEMYTNQEVLYNNNDFVHIFLTVCETG